MKRAIVTGASRGIGRGIALRLAQDGYDIAFSYDSRKDEAEKTARMIERESGKKCYYFQASLQDAKAGEESFDQALQALGGLELLVNNAGRTIFEPLQEMSDDALDLLINLDFRTYIVLMRSAVKHMIKRGTKGSIVNITSSRSQQSYPADGLYGGLKAGLNRAIESFALDVSEYGIRINNVAPGAIRIRTREELEEAGNSELGEFWDELGQRIPLGRAGLTEDVANAVAFLASDQAAYITGTTLRVDGGIILPGMPEVLTEDLKPGQWRSYLTKRL